MKNTSKWIALLLVLAMCLGLAACSGGSTADNNTIDNKDASGALRTVTDIFGRTVEVPAVEDIESVAALGSAARILCYAGATDKLVGVTESDLAKRAGKPYSYAYADDLARCIALSTGGSNESSYAEAIIETSPDVIFYFDSDPVATEELAQKTGLPVVGIYAHTWYDQTFYDSLTLIGDILGKRERTDAVIAALQGWFADLDSLTSNVSDAEKPTAYVGAVSWGGGHGIEGTYGQYPPFVAIHANSVTAVLDAEDFVEIDKEQIAAWDPDYIFLTGSNMDIVNEDYANNPVFYDSLSAVQNGNVYSQVNFNWYWTNQELAVVNAYYAASVLYPEQFAQAGINFEAKAEEIFETMLGMPYLDIMRENGMAFSRLTIGG